MMEVLIAIAHFLGAMAVLFIFAGLLLFYGMWQSKRNGEKLLMEISIQQGVNYSDSHLDPAVASALSQFYSSALLRNRLSDFCGTIRTLWSWIENLAILLILIGVGWETITENLKLAVYAWTIVLVWASFEIISGVFSTLCKLITGRYPDQAKAGRKFLAEYINDNGELNVLADSTADQ